MMSLNGFPFVSSALLYYRQTCGAYPHLLSYFHVQALTDS